MKTSLVNMLCKVSGCLLMSGIFSACAELDDPASEGNDLGLSSSSIEAGGSSAARDSAEIPPRPDVKSFETGMVVVGFDKGVAEKNGYEIRTDVAGNHYTVLAGSPPDAAPENFVSGNCGDSWLYEDGVGNLCVMLRTGFTVKGRAVSYFWRVLLADNGGISYQQWSGGLLLRTDWRGERRVCGLTRGSADSWLVSGYAVLSNGAICTSLGPYSYTTIY
jgi:hypothetical protein